MDNPSSSSSSLATPFRASGKCHSLSYLRSLRDSLSESHLDEASCHQGGSEYQEDLDGTGSSEWEGSDLERHSESEIEDGRCLSMSQSGSLRRKRGKGSQEYRDLPTRKKIRMHVTRGTSEYPAIADAPGRKTSGVSAPYCSEKSHVDPSKGCPFTPLTKCAILHQLGMYFGPYGFVCEKCNQIYPPRYLLGHISKRHQQDLDITVTGKRKKQLYQIITEHLLAAHGVVDDTVTFELPQTLPDVILGLLPSLCYSCPTCSEPRWLAWASLIRHYREEHQGVKFPQKRLLQPRYIMRPYKLGCLERAGGRSRLTDIVILLPVGWTPNSGSEPDHLSIPADRPAACAGAPHLVAMGWTDYLRSLKGADTKWLLKLVEMPKEMEVKSYPPKRAALERGLLRVDGLLVRYLVDANAFLDVCHPSVRRSITIGTKAHYRGLAGKTYTGYRTIMTKTVSMLVRAHYFSRLVDQSLSKQLGVFSVVKSKEQAANTAALYRYLISGSGEDDEEFSAHAIVLVHRLLVSLVHHSIHGTRKMECPTDQSLFLVSLRFSPEGVLQFQTASQLTRDCAILQYWFFTIVAHISRLEASGKDEFHFFASQHQEIAEEIILPTGSEGMEAVVPQAVAGREEDRDEEEEMDDGDGPDGDGDGMQEEEGAWGNSPAANILRVINQERQSWLRITPKHDYFTPYDRLKSVWYDAAPTAFKEGSKIGHAFQPDGTTMIVDAVGRAHRIDLTDIGKEARRIALEIEEMVYQWLPKETGHVFSSFPDASQLSDDLNDPASIFRQKGNTSLLEPVIRTVKTSVFQSFLGEEDMLAWLQHNEHFLTLFLVATALTCGIPPRPFQFTTLQFDHCSQTGTSRGLFLIDGCLAIGKPVAKLAGKSQQNCLWFLPPALTSCLLFYLAVLRPLVIELLTCLRKEVGRQDSLIFCRTIPRTTGSYSWSGHEITLMLREHTKKLDVTLSVDLLRQLYSAFFRQYFPSVCGSEAEEDSLVDRQGQHRFYTGQRHYGQTIGSVLRSLGIDLPEARKFGAMSQLLHIIFEFRSPDEQWQQVLEHSDLLGSARHDRHALDTARLSVLCEYNILSRGAGPTAAFRARQTLKLCPFLKVPARVGESFGDTVLIQVLRARVLGKKGPGRHDHQIPPEGYPASVAAGAATLIIQAIEEWADGNYKPVSDQFDLKAGQHFKNVERLAEKFLRDAKDKWPEEWRELSQAAHAHSPHNFKESWSMRGLPEEAYGQ